MFNPSFFADTGSASKRDIRHVGFRVVGVPNPRKTSLALQVQAVHLARFSPVNAGACIASF